MPNAPENDETKFNETLKRMLNTPPKPHKPKAKPAAKKQRSKAMRVEQDADEKK